MATKNTDRNQTQVGVWLSDDELEKLNKAADVLNAKKSSTFKRLLELFSVEEIAQRHVEELLARAHA